MRILHLSHAKSAVDGGITAAVGQLVASQRQNGLDALWLTAEDHPPWRRDRSLLAGAAATGAALAHIHGLWRSPTRIASALAQRCPLLIAPHGMFDPWALRQSRWKKRIVWSLWEQRALRAACCLQALGPAELVAIRSLGIKAPVAVIPNGVEPPDPAGSVSASPWVDRLPAGERVLLFLGRFHTKKGIEPLLAAWRHVTRKAAVGGWWLVLVGYGDQGRLAARLEAEPIPRCLLFGPCFGEQKKACLAAASAFVLPSFSEGLPVAALEALSWGLPCLLSPACNLPEALTFGAALAVQPTAKDLARGLEQLMVLPAATLSAMGDSGRQLVAERFAWPSIAAQCSELYRWILGGGIPPSFVDTGTP